MFFLYLCSYRHSHMAVDEFGSYSLQYKTKKCSPSCKPCTSSMFTITKSVSVPSSGIQNKQSDIANGSLIPSNTISQLSLYPRKRYSSTISLRKSCSVGASFLHDSSINDIAYMLVCYSDRMVVYSSGKVHTLTNAVPKRSHNSVGEQYLTHNMEVIGSSSIQFTLKIKHLQATANASSFLGEHKVNIDHYILFELRFP